MNILSKVFGLKSKNNLLALDIGTESVKALIFSFDNKEEKVVICGAGKKGHRLEDIHGGIIFNVDGVVETCKSAIKEAEEMAKIKPSKAIVSMGGEHVKNITRTSSFDRENSKAKINLAELEDLISESQKKISSAAEKSLNSDRWKEKKLIGADIVDFSIDGYRVINPVNFKGKNIRISVSNSYITGEQFKLVGKILVKLDLGLANISYGPYAVLKAIGAQDIMDFNALFIDVGGGMTDVVVVRNRNIGDSRLFIFGGKAFTKSIANEFKVSFSEAEEIKLDYSHDKIAENIKERVEKIIRSDCDVWSSGIELSLEELSKNDLLPSKIFLYGGGSQLPQIRTSLERSLRINKFSFSDKPEINFISPEDIINAKDMTQSAGSTQYVTALSLANLSLDLANEEDFPNKILKKCYL
ncbi:MAG: cell division FtsA domain-containing protein [Minisyncoccia bacterium]